MFMRQINTHSLKIDVLRDKNVNIDKKKILIPWDQTTSQKHSTKCPQTFSLEKASIAQRSEAERSCLNTGDGCNRILSLNDGQQGEHAITSSQPVHQSVREEEKNEEEEETIG